MAKQKNKTPNSLVNETSPYLLQHAYNPVNWLPFGEQAFELARKQNKPLLISIGYSACHWCHVMEHESFEDEAVAELMNEHFVNVKVDREERGDVDMLYMQAVQLMTGRGGWPLNCFVLPDGRPFYGGTYFQKAQWMNVLKNLAQICVEEPAKVEAYAEELTSGIVKSELITTQPGALKELDKTLLHSMVKNWKRHLDSTYGGPNRAPKFPMPSNYVFLLRYASMENDTELLDHVNLTLTQMALGGIYDQLHGGFSRYSTDVMWKVPHFEKMLYDNAQLLSLYAEAYTKTGNQLYKQTAYGIIDFVKEEWFQSQGSFFSALDADSDGEEGKYYVWNKADLEDVLGEDFDFFTRCFEVNDTGYWEHGNYILMKKNNLAEAMVEMNLNSEELEKRINTCKSKLRQEAKSRIKPGLDDKIITSWNAMMCSALAKSYLSFGNSEFKTMALASAQFLKANLFSENGKLFRTHKNGVSKIDGFLEDYVFVAEAFINCYLITQKEEYLTRALQITEFCLAEFNNPESDLLFFTGQSSARLVARTSETSDNVTPASNSQMALNLFYLGTYFANTAWIKKSEKMLQVVLPQMLEYGGAYSNWACLALHFTHPFKELAIVGKHVNEYLKELWQHGLTNTIFAVTASVSELPLLKNRWVEQQTTIYVCENNTCKLPVTSATEALKQLV